MLKNQYGLTEEQYEEMLAKQDGKCAICRAEQVWRKNTTRVRLSIDHDHKTGKIRGLLCQPCNTAIGLLGDDSVLIERALNYLKEER